MAVHCPALPAFPHSLFVHSSGCLVSPRDGPGLNDARYGTRGGQGPAHSGSGHCLGIKIRSPPPPSPLETVNPPLARDVCLDVPGQWWGESPPSVMTNHGGLKHGNSCGSTGTTKNYVGSVMAESGMTVARGRLAPPTADNKIPRLHAIPPPPPQGDAEGSQGK